MLVTKYHLFFVLFHFPQFKRHSGATNDGFVPIRLGNMRNPSTRWGTKKEYFFFYHTLLGSSIHVQNLLTRLIQIFEKSLKIKVFPYHFIKWVTQLQGVVILNVIKLENLLKIKNRRH